MVYSDELFVIRKHKRNGQPDQGVCDIRMRFTQPLSSVCDLCGNRSLPRRLFVYHGNRPPTLRLSLSIWNCCRTLFLSLLHFPSALHPFFCHCSIVFSMEGTGQKRPCYSCPDLKDDVVEELIDRCNVITLASMAGSFKPILDSTNNIITRNPRVQERFDLPYLLRYKHVRMDADDRGLALCKLMPLDNDTCDVKMHRLRASLG